MAECSAIRRRAVVPSATTRNRETPRQVHPAFLATMGARRALRSTPITVRPASATVAFTSLTATCPVGGCQARTSIDPRSPNSENVASTITSHPARRYSRTSTTMAACAASRSLSRFASLPLEVEAEPTVERLGDGYEIFPVRARDHAMFDSPDGAARYARRGGEITLPPRPSHAKCPDAAAEADPVHQRSMA